MMKRDLAFVFLFLLFAADSSAINGDSLNVEEKPEGIRYSTYFIPIQYAGNIGMVSSGVGYASQRDTYQLSLVYGYTPASMGGVTVHTVAVRNVFHITRFPISDQKALVPYGALGVALELGGRSWFSLPDNMPKDYYNFPKSIHAIPALGIKLRTINDSEGIFSGAEFFVEASSVDVNVWYKFISSDVKMGQIVSLSFGVNLLRH